MSLEKQMADLKSSIADEINNSRDMIYSYLVEGVKPATLPESIFVNYFLPYFTGDRSSNIWVSEWISIAGTPMAEVMIVEDNTGKELFLVPSIFNTNGLFTMTRPGSYNDIFHRAEQLSNNIPITGFRFLLEALHSKSMTQTAGVDFTDVDRKWYYILSRYNKEPTGHSSQTQQQDNVSDYFDY